MMCLMQGGRATGFSNSILRPWRNNLHGSYDTTLFFSALGYAQRATGGAMLRDNLDEVAKMEDAYAPENWKTRIDQWDWRTQWEVDGTIKDLPLTQKWLRRVRGE